MKTMTQKTMIKNLAAKFGIPSVSAEEFYGYKHDGIWCRGDICTESTDYYPYAEGTMQDNKLNTYLHSKGWFAEPYDSETIMFHKG